MNVTAASSTMSYARSGRSGGAVHIDTVTMAIVLSIALLGLVMVTSASVSIASKDTGEAFFYLERQLVLMLIGAFPAWPYSRGWGYYPSGGLGLVLIIVIILIVLDVV